MHIIIETPRLILREMGMDDLDSLAAMLADPEVMRYWPRPYTRAESADWIARQQERYARYGHGYWLAIDRALGQVVGQAGLLINEVEGVPERALGYIIARPFWRRGYAAEAAAATRDYAFDRLGLPYVIALIRPENLPSQAVARAIGMRPGRTVRYADLDHIVFAIERPATGDRPPTNDQRVGADERTPGGDGRGLIHHGDHGDHGEHSGRGRPAG